ncbi:MAG: peptidase T [Nanoarchaeota archaeon]
MDEEISEKLVHRLVQYARVGTQSNEGSETSPSTEVQKILSAQLRDELILLGLDADMDEKGYVYGRLPGHIETAPAIGFIAHLDTATGVSASCVEPQVHHNYQGGDISLEDGVRIAASELKNHVGDTIISSNGRTLLGADDKAGISVIMTAMELIKTRWDGQHGDVYVMFNPDEEVGRGTEHFNPEKFPVTAAFTMDGGGVGEIECETFYAAKAVVTFKGTPVHPGVDGYQKLINPVSIACEYERAIPATERPETTRERFGFYYPMNMNGNPEKATLDILLRDFDKEKLQRRKEFLTKLADIHNTTYGAGTVTVEIKDQYPNMKATLDEHPAVVQVAVEAMRKAGVAEPRYPVIRGGTDGATLTVEKGIPTPNISAGMYNIHSVKEFASARDMGTATHFILNVVRAYAELA